MSEQLDRIEADVRTIKVWITGNGHPEEGLLFRVAQLERDEKRQRQAKSWFWKTLGACVIALAVSGVASAAVYIIRGTGPAPVQRGGEREER